MSRDTDHELTSVGTSLVPAGMAFDMQRLRCPHGAPSSTRMAYAEAQMDAWGFTFCKKAAKSLLSGCSDKPLASCLRVHSRE